MGFVIGNSQQPFLSNTEHLGSGHDQVIENAYIDQARQHVQDMLGTDPPGLQGQFDGHLHGFRNVLGDCIENLRHAPIATLIQTPGTAHEPDAIIVYLARRANVCH